ELHRDDALETVRSLRVHYSLQQRGPCPVGFLWWRRSRRVRWDGRLLREYEWLCLYSLLLTIYAGKPSDREILRFGLGVLVGCCSRNHQLNFSPSVGTAP